VAGVALFGVLWLLAAADSPSPSPITSASPSPSASVSASATPTPDFPIGTLHGGGLTFIEFLLLALMAFVLFLPLMLARGRPRFFDTPYITWFLLHYGIGALAILALVALALGNALGAPVIAIFSGLFGFIFGSTAARAAGAGGGASASLNISGIIPRSGGAGPVAIYGQGIDPHATATLGEGEVTINSVAPDGSALIGTAPARAAGPGQVDVIVTNPDGTTKKITKGFTYT